MFRAFSSKSFLFDGGVMKTGKAIALLAVSLASISQAAIKNYTVSATAGKGTHLTIQAAVNDCSSDDVCTINLVDAAYSIPRPIWIEGKSRITIQGVTATGVRPKLTYAAGLADMVTNPLTGTKVQAKVRKVFTLPFLIEATGLPCANDAGTGCTVDTKRPAGWAMWPYKAASADPVPNNDPGDKSDVSNPYSSSGFQRNGMFVVEKSVDINIRGLSLDGVQPMYFVNNGIWSQKYDVLFGSVGVNSMQSLRTTVQDCELKNFFSGFYINGRNPGGTYGQANPDDLDLTNIVPLSRFGKSGDHTFEKNFVHDNWWFLYDEIEWDMGSTIRYNVAWNNINKAFQYGDSLKDADATGDEMNNQTGGFVYMKDVTLVTHKIYNNTLYKHGIVLGFGGWRAGTQHLFYNNVLAGPIDSLKSGNTVIKYGQDWHQMLQLAGTTIYNNTFELEGGVKYGYQTASQANIVSDTFPDENSPGKVCYPTGCWATIEPVKYVSQIQPEFLWNNWGIAQGGSFDVYTTDKAGKRWGPFKVYNSQLRDSTGLIIKMQGSAADSNIWKQHLNMYALKIPFQSRTPTAATFMMPQWGENIVNKAIRHQGWSAAHRNFDGTLVDRGAYCYDSLADKTILGMCGSQAGLEIVDQQIVKMNDSKAVQIPVSVREIGADFSDIKIDSIFYYPKLAWADKATNGKDAVTNTNAVLATPIKIPASAITFRNDSVFFNVPNLPAATVDFARFDVFSSGVLATSTERVPSTPGIFIWRRNPVELLLKVCEDQACARPTNKVGVGDTVYLDIQGVTSAGVKLTTDITKLFLNPPAGVRIFDVTNSKMVDTAMFRATVAGGHGVFKIVFESRFKDILTAAGIAQDPVSKGYFGAVGQIALHVTSGKPWRAEWEAPRSLESTNHACTDASDITNAMCDEIPPILPFNAKLRVYDRFGNSVDGYNGSITVKAIDERGVAMTFSATATGTFGATASVISTDSTATAAIIGTPAGGIWPLTTAILTAQVDATPGAPLDSTRIRVGKPSDRLGWLAPVVIDTFINVPMKLTLMVTENGVTPTTAGLYSNSKAFIGPVVTTRLKFFADAAMTTPIVDTVTLKNGVVDIWVMSETPFHPLWDSVVARMAGLADPKTYPAGIRFRMPPKPEAPEPQAGTFYDVNCDGYADSVFVKWLPLSNTVKVNVLDTSRVKINQVVLYASAADSLVLDATAVRILPSAAGGVGIVLPASAATRFAQYNPTATIRLTASLSRKPAADTVVQLGAVAVVNDGIGPRPIGAVLIENPDPSKTPDSLFVQFSEKVVFNGSSFPFLTYAAGMMQTDPSAIRLIKGEKGPATTLLFEFTGNTGVVGANTILAIDPTSGLTDVAGNTSRISPCILDTALVRIKPVVVGVTGSIIFDRNGDGQADLVRVSFRRDFLKETEKPDSVTIYRWDGAKTTTVGFGAAVQVAPATYEIALIPPYALGVTTGANPDGTGTVGVARGVVTELNPTQKVPLIDSVPPIAVDIARIVFGSAVDTLTIRYSEPMTLSAADGKVAMVLKTSAGDLPLVLLNGDAIDTTKMIWRFNVLAGTVQVGDEIRLPTSALSSMKASNGMLPSALGAAPYVPVVGGDRAPDSAWVLDLNGDGSGDAVRLVYSKAPRGNPTFGFTWNGEFVQVDSIGYASVVAGKTDLIIPVSPFKFGTSGSGMGSSVSYVGGLAEDKIGFKLLDGMAPVMDSTNVFYARAEGLPDTIRVKLSEPASAITPDNSGLILVKHNGIVGPVKAGVPAAMSVSFTPGSDFFLMICSSEDCNLPGFKDSARLAKGSVTDLGGASVGDSSRWVLVRTGMKPIRYEAAVYPKAAVLFETDGKNPLSVVGPVSVWVRPEGGLQWTPMGETKTLWPTPINDADLRSDAPLPGLPRLAGIKLDLSTSFDGQFFVYDNLGTYVGKIAVKLDLESLRNEFLVGAADKYSVFVGLNGLNSLGKDLASGVYMIRVVGYSDRPLNGSTVRVMVPNQVFSFGLHRKIK